ncbi:hypothetical protein ACIQJX_26865 [Streptomyces griseoviridis]
MKRMPRLPADTSCSLDTPPPGTRLRRWIRRRRRDAINHLLRGLCYGTGTGIAGLACWWLEQHL